MKKHYVTALILTSLLSMTAQAATEFFDDFEDGNHDGWSITNTGGTGGTGVWNGVAWVNHLGTNSHALSREFMFSADQMLSFDMQAIVNSVFGGVDRAHAWSGATVSFLDSLNFELGTVTFHLGTDGSGSVPDQNWHNYTASMTRLTELAGTNLLDPTKIGLSFWAAGDTTFSGNSEATVLFDNVSLTAVPLPAAFWLFISSFLGIVGIAIRNKNA